MANFNKVILAGNITRDPEVRYTPSGTAIAKFGIAVNRSWRTETGETREEVTFVDIDAFGRQAETIGKYFKKGRSILVEGRLKLDQWEDKTTHQKKSRLGVVLESFSFLDSKGGDNVGASGAAPRSRPAASAPSQMSPPPDEPPPPSEDEVPF